MENKNSYEKLLKSSIDKSNSYKNNHNNLNNTLFLYILTLLACIGGFLFGYDTGIISGALILINDTFNLNNIEKELIVTTTIFGAMLSASTSGPICDKFGRKPVVLLSAIIFVIGSIVMAFANSYEILLVGRFIVGLGVGSASMNMPIIISEMAETSQRGTLVTCVNVSITGGQFISCIIAGSLSNVPNGWRYMLGIAAIPAFIQFIGFSYMPESPRWLIENDHIEKATEILQKIRGTDDVYEELEEIIAAIEQERGKIIRNEFGAEFRVDNPQKQEKKTLFQHLSSPYIRRALFLGCCLQAGQQLGGINTVMYYSATILKLAGFTSNSTAIWLSAVVSFFNFLGSCVGLHYVDKLGRRSLTIYSQISTVICLTLLAVFFYFAQHNSQHLITTSYDTNWNNNCNNYKYCFDCIQDSNCGYCSSANYLPPSYDTKNIFSSSQICMKTLQTDDNDEKETHSYNQTICSNSNFYANSCPNSSIMGWMIFMILCLYLLGFSPGMGPMPWCINSEIYPTTFRGMGNSISTTINWLCNIFMSLTFLTIINILTKQGAFLLYAFISFLFLIIFLIYLPETKNISLENIYLLFLDGQWGNNLTCNKIINSNDNNHNNNNNNNNNTYQRVNNNDVKENLHLISNDENNDSNNNDNNNNNHEIESSEEEKTRNSQSSSFHHPQSRNSGGLNDTFVEGSAQSAKEGSYQSKMSYMSYNHVSCLPPVDLFQSDSSTQSLDNLQVEINSNNNSNLVSEQNDSGSTHRSSVILL